MNPCNKDVTMSYAAGLKMNARCDSFIIRPTNPFRPHAQPELVQRTARLLQSLYHELKYHRPAINLFLPVFHLVRLFSVSKYSHTCPGNPNRHRPIPLYEPGHIRSVPLKAQFPVVRPYTYPADNGKLTKTCLSGPFCSFCQQFFPESPVLPFPCLRF